MKKGELLVERQNKEVVKSAQERFRCVDFTAMYKDSE